MKRGTPAVGRLSATGLYWENITGAAAAMCSGLICGCCSSGTLMAGRQARRITLMGMIWNRFETETSFR
jgi:hypothetical protein